MDPRITIRDTNPREADAFDALGLGHYATPDEIDRHWRQKMLHVHPDKAKDDGARARACNEARDVAKKYARDPANDVRLTHMRAVVESMSQQAERLRRVEAILRHRSATLSSPTAGSVARAAATFNTLAKDWTQQQRQEADDAVRFGLERHPVIDERDALLEKNAMLSGKLTNVGRQVVRDFDKVVADLKKETQRSEHLEESLAEEKHRADTATAGLAEETQRAEAAEASVKVLQERLDQMLAQSGAQAEKRRRFY